jgi:hypothetical protein
MSDATQEHGSTRALVERAIQAEHRTVPGNRSDWLVEAAYGELDAIRAEADELDARPRPLPKEIESEAEHEAALARIDTLMNSDTDDDLLKLLAILVEDYERTHYPIGDSRMWPPPTDAAVKALAEALWDERHYVYQWSELGDAEREWWLKRAAAVLARLNLSEVSE